MFGLGCAEYIAAPTEPARDVRAIQLSTASVTLTSPLSDTSPAAASASSSWYAATVCARARYAGMAAPAP